MAGYVTDIISIEGFKEYFDMFDDSQIDANFSRFLSTYLKSCKCSFEDKIYFLESFAKDIEKRLEFLEIQIQPQIVQYQRSFENLVLPKPKKEVLPFNDEMEECFENEDDFERS